MKEIDEIVRKAGEKAHQETSDEPEPKYTGACHFPMEISVGAGLDGAVACSTNVGYVNGAKGWLVYRGYNCFDLAERSNFEETTYLLLFGKLPTKAELDAFSAKLIKHRPLPHEVLDLLKKLPTAKAHPMSSIRTAVSVLGMLDPTADETTVEKETEAAIKLTARLATIAGAVARIRKGEEPLPPDPELSHSANFYYMMTGNKPDAMNERILDVSLILHADHGLNASTFTTMVVNSSLSDMYGSVVAGIASLKGPLHGGANEKVLYDLEEIGNARNVGPWYEKAKASKRKIMGFGHRVYKTYDPRARILGPLADLMTRKHHETREIYDTAVALEWSVVRELGQEKKIFPNVDFYSGIIYRAMGIETAMFTPIFAVSRISGWAARTLEYLASNRLFRPRAIYTGPIKKEYVRIEERV